MERLLDQLDTPCEGIVQLEASMEALFACDARMGLLPMLPNVEYLLASVILGEIGDIGRFPSPGQLLFCCGLVTRVHSSGGRARFGRLRVEAACWVLVRNQCHHEPLLCGDLRLAG